MILKWNTILPIVTQNAKPCGLMNDDLIIKKTETTLVGSNPCGNIFYSRDRPRGCLGHKKMRL